MQNIKPPCEPKWAIIFSILALPVGTIGAILAHYFLYTSWIESIGWSALFVYLTLGLFWSFLDWHTRHLAIRGNNFFVVLAVIVFIIATITGEDYGPFPTWGTVVLIVGGIAGYSVLGVCGIINFLKWRKGEFPAWDSQVE